MDALGTLNSLGTLKQLIPSLSFVGIYTDHLEEEKDDTQHITPVNSWTFGISTVSATNGHWSDGGGSSSVWRTPVITILTSPGIKAYPHASSYRYGLINFLIDKIVITRTVQFTALLFNY